MPAPGRIGPVTGAHRRVERSTGLVVNVPGGGISCTISVGADRLATGTRPVC